MTKRRASGPLVASLASSVILTAGTLARADGATPDTPRPETATAARADAAASPAAPRTPLAPPPDADPDDLEAAGFASVTREPSGRALARWRRDDSAMVFVAPGTATLSLSEDEARPEVKCPPPTERKVLITGFYIDVAEVTIGQFRAFVEETGYLTDAEREGVGHSAASGDGDRDSRGVSWRLPLLPRWRDGPLGAAAIKLGARHPVVLVSWNDAAAYARWAGKELPTEAQWTVAARGREASRVYPWGSGAPSRAAVGNFADGALAAARPGAPVIAGYDDGEAFLSASGYAAGDSPVGCGNMAGNVAEWCADGRGALRAVKGGHWASTADALRSSSRDLRAPDERFEWLGFRCAVRARPSLPQDRRKAPLDEDAKHRLYQAGAMTGDATTIMRVLKRIGIMAQDGMPTPPMQAFVTAHGEWAQRNVAFLQAMSTPEKARAYVEAELRRMGER